MDFDRLKHRVKVGAIAVGLVGAGYFGIKELSEKLAYEPRYNTGSELLMYLSPEEIPEVFRVPEQPVSYEEKMRQAIEGLRSPAASESIHGIKEARERADFLEKRLNNEFIEGMDIQEQRTMERVLMNEPSQEF